MCQFTYFLIINLLTFLGWLQIACWNNDTHFNECTIQLYNRYGFDFSVRCAPWLPTLYSYIFKSDYKTFFSSIGNPSEDVSEKSIKFKMAKNNPFGVRFWRGCERLRRETHNEQFVLLQISNAMTHRLETKSGRCVPNVNKVCCSRERTGLQLSTHKHF